MIAVKIKEHHWLPRAWSRVAGFRIVAMVIGRRIYVPGAWDDLPERTRRHEYVHVLQCAEMGLAAAAWQYAKDYFVALRALRSRKAAYRAVRAEQEARFLADFNIPWEQIGEIREPYGWRAFDLLGGGNDET